MKNFLLVLALFFSLTIYSQSAKQQKINELRILVNTNISDSLKIKSYSDLCWYYGNISIDSAFYFGNLALDLSKEKKNLQGEAQAYNDIGILHYQLAEYDQAIALYKSSLRIRKSKKDSLGIASLYNKLGIAFHRKSTYDSALYYDNKALQIYNAKNHLKYVSIIKNNIANIYNDLKQYEKALESNKEVARIQKEISDHLGLARSYNNIGNSYLFLNDTLQSLDYYLKAINISEKNNFDRELGASYNNYGTILQSQKKFKKALIYLNKSLVIKKKIKDNYGISSGILNVAILNLQIGNLQPVEKQLRQGLAISKNSGINKLTLNAYSSFVTFYALKKNADSVIKYQKLYMQTQDLLLNERITKEVAEIQEKYNTVEREKEIALQKEELLKQKLELQTKNLYALLLAAGVLIVSLVSFGNYKYQKNKRKQLREKLRLKDELSKTKTQNKLQEQRLRISRDLHDNIGSQLTFIISSIDNLKFLTKSSNDDLKSKLTSINSFASNTISQLRDTIWAMNKNEIPYEDFQSRVLSLIEKAKIAKENIQFDFESDVKSEIIFSSVNGITIFRVLQEALNNALKYADANNIKIGIIEKKNTLQISITDNGNGFDINTVEIGNGLENMQKRMGEIDGKIIINSKIDVGTSINISIKNT